MWIMVSQMFNFLYLIMGQSIHYLNGKKNVYLCIVYVSQTRVQLLVNAQWNNC